MGPTHKLRTLRSWALRLLAIALALFYIIVISMMREHSASTVVSDPVKASSEPLDPELGEVRLDLLISLLKTTVGPALRSQLLFPNHTTEAPLSCAVVGESTSLYTGPQLYVDDINSHDVVIRLPQAEGRYDYRNLQATMRGSKTSFEVHHTEGKTDWATSSGEHKLCGVHPGVPILLMPELCNPETIRKLSEGCGDKVAHRELSFLTAEDGKIFRELHGELVRNVSAEESALPFTEEWIATYAALAICDTVNLFGVVTETVRYAYFSDKSSVSKPEVPNIADVQPWVQALDSLGVKDVAHNWLAETFRAPDASRPLPEWQLKRLRTAFRQYKEELNVTLGNSTRVIAENKSCVVVGAAPDTLGEGWGEWIDSHDFVWRLNNHKPDIDSLQVAMDLGRRTDVRFSWRENVMLPAFINTMKETRQANDRAFGYFYPPREAQHWPAPTQPTEIVEGSDFYLVDFGVYNTTHSFLKNISKTTYENGWFFHSTGHLAVNTAMFVCNKTAAAGFGLGRLMILHHGMLLESAVLELYRQAGFVDVRFPEAVSERLRVYVRNMVKSGVIALL